MYRSSGEAGRSWGEGVSQWMGKTGHLPRKERAGCGGGSEVAAEERGGRGEANALRKGAESARPVHACARLAPPGRRPGLQTARPAPTARTLQEEETRGPSPPGPDGPFARLSRWRVVTCFFSGDLGSREREHVSLLCSFRSPPPRRMGREVLGVSRKVRSGFSRPL